MNPLKEVIPSVVILLIIVIIGTSGYIMIEDWSFLESIYMVIITLFTIGFKEARELSSNGRIFTIFIILGGVGTAVYAAGQIVEIIVEGHLSIYNRRKKMEKKISQLKDHFIICGYGRVGKQVAEDLSTANIPYVVVDRQQEIIKVLDPLGIPYVIGDIINDDNLVRAGILNAKGLIANADSDVANLFVTLSAKALNSKLYVIARTSDLDTEKKLKTAGADRVMSPYYVSGRKIASLAIRPHASDFLDTLMYSKNSDIILREISITENSGLVDTKLSQADIIIKSDIMVVAIRDGDGEFILHPDGETLLKKNDTLVLIGNNSQLEILKRIVYWQQL